MRADHDTLISPVSDRLNPTRREDHETVPTRTAAMQHGTQGYLTCRATEGSCDGLTQPSTQAAKGRRSVFNASRLLGSVRATGSTRGDASLLGIALAFFSLRSLRVPMIAGTPSQKGRLECGPFSAFRFGLEVLIQVQTAG